MNGILHTTAKGRSATARRWRRVVWASLMPLGLLGCVTPTMPSMPASITALAAQPNPSTDGAYTLRWPHVVGATRYRLFENDELAYEGFRLSHAVAGKPDGSYAYSLTYCVEAFGIEVCQLRPVRAEVTVVVATPRSRDAPPNEAAP